MAVAPLLVSSHVIPPPPLVQQLLWGPDLYAHLELLCRLQRIITISNSCWAPDSVQQETNGWHHTVCACSAKSLGRRLCQLRILTKELL